MFFTAQKLINGPVGDSSKPDLGFVLGFVVDLEKGKIYALKISKERLVLFSNIKNFAKNRATILSQGLIPVKKQEADQKRVEIVGNRALTESGEVLGELFDFEFDDVSGLIVKYHIKTSLLRDLFKGNLIVSRNQVISLSQEEIIVSDDVVKARKRPKSFPKKEEALPLGATVAKV